MDATRVIDEFEAPLTAGSEPTRCYEAAAIRWRWQRNGDLDERSGRSAETLASVVRRYQRYYM